MYKELQPLTKLLGKHFNLNPSRTKCMAEMALCMIKLRTVNMADICQAMSGESKASSNYRKLQRFIGEELIPQKSLAELTCAIKGLDKKEKW